MKNFNEVTCDDCQEFWQNYCPVCKKSIREYGIKEPVTKKESKKIRRQSKTQELPISINNFFISTYGDFDEINDIPEGFTRFFRSKESDYFTNESKDVLIRRSNHWGYNIRFCSWHLKGYEKNTAWKWQKNNGTEYRIGIIKISDLEPNKAFNNTIDKITSVTQYENQEKKNQAKAD